MELSGKMKKGIIVLDADKNSSRVVSDMLTTRDYPNTVTRELSYLANLIETNQYVAVIFDIDSVPVDNRTIRALALKYPGLCILCTSKGRFHPELKDAICYHIYACLNKPIDPDELLFWIKSIYEEESESRGPPNGSD
jgi:DNA-binding NtrC family response regulator